MMWVRAVHNGQPVWVHKQGDLFRKLRKKVLNRDNHTCQNCGVTRERKPQSEHNFSLECHHIKPAKDYPELFLDPDNCVILCGVCHRLTRSKFIPRPVIKRRFRQFYNDWGYSMKEIASANHGKLAHSELRKYGCFLLLFGKNIRLRESKTDV